MLKRLSRLATMSPPLADRLRSAARPLPPIAEESFG